MTLEDSIAAIANRITLVVTIRGVVLSPLNSGLSAGTPGCSGYQLRKDIETKDPVCDLYVNFIPDWILDGDAVTVDAGYDGFTQRRFTGTVQNLQHGFGQQTIECHGTMWLLVRQLDAPDIVVDGLTVDQAIVARLEFVGITNHSIAVSSFVLGSVVEAKLAEGQTLDQVAQLLDIADGQLYELGNGQIVGQGEMYFLPAPTAFRNYATHYQENASTGSNVRILDGSDHEDPDYFRDHIVATGASLPDGDPDDPDTVFEPVLGEVSLLGASIRQPPAPPGVFATQPLSNDLIDTQPEIDAYAQRKLTKLARIPRYLSIEQVADPRLEVGMTLNYDIGEMRVTGNWFLAAFVETCVPGQGFRQTVEVTGGSRFGGSIAQDPHAAFTYSSVLQSFGGVMMQITTLDGSGSFAGDGTITAWDWTGDFTGSGERLVIMFDPTLFPDGPEMILTVTASNTLTDDQAQTINKDPENAGATPINQPSVWYSADISLGATPDAGASWNDLAATAGRGVDTKPNDGTSAGIAVHGDGDTLVRTTNFDLASAVVWAGGAGDITYVWWDKVVSTNCWAATDTGAILRSTDDGATFTVYRAATGYPVNALATPQGPQPSIWAFGGRGDDAATLVQFNIVGSGTWTPVGFAGGQADPTGATSALTITAAASRLANELVVGFGGELHPAGTNVFRTLSVFDGGAGWLQAIGLDGKVQVRFVAPDFGPGVFHVGYAADTSGYNTVDGLNFTEVTDVFPAGYEPNQCLWEGDFLGGLDGIFLIAVENATGDGGIMKNVVGFLGASDWFRGEGIGGWPPGAKCKSISIGVGGQGVSTGQITRFGADRQVEEFNGSSTWTTIRAADTDVGLSFAMRFVTGVLLGLRVNRGMMYSGPTDTAFVETLGFITNFVVQGFDVGASGRVWAVKSGSAGDLEIHSSDDQGATFDLNYTDPSGDADTPFVGKSLVADKWNANNIFIACQGDGVDGAPTRIYSIDGGANWLSPTTGPMPNASSGEMQFVNNGRIVLLAGDGIGSDEGAWHTDDMGDTWVDAGIGTTLHARLRIAPYRAGHFNRGVISQQPTSGSSPPDEIWITSDNHDSYTLLPITFSAHISGLEYDAINDRLYVGVGDVEVAVIDGVFDGTPTVTDITFNLATSFDPSGTAVVLPR